MTAGPDPAPRRPGRLTIALAALIAVALVAVGGALAVLVLGRGVPAADSVDAGFARDMSTHHRQAVGMAGLARDRTADPAIRTVAFDIETSQNQQVGLMQGWLQAWDAPVNSPAEQMAWMSGHPQGVSMDSGAMPGMASESELARLQTLTGDGFDVLFLQLMIRHHQGGLPMARAAVEQAETDVVRRFAQRVLDNQGAEILTLDRMLGERGGSMLPPS